MKFYIARDGNEDGFLWLFKEYPIKKDNIFYPTTDMNGKFTYFRSMPIDLFPEVTFENSPQESELKLVSEIIGITKSPSKTFPRVNEFEAGSSYRR